MTLPLAAVLFALAAFVGWLVLLDENTASRWLERAARRRVAAPVPSLGDTIADRLGRQSNARSPTPARAPPDRSVAPPARGDAVLIRPASPTPVTRAPEAATPALRAIDSATPMIEAAAGEPGFLRTLLEFTGRFNSEEDCSEYLVAVRFPGGFKCPVCASPHSKPTESPRLLACRNGHRVSLTGGTVMHNSGLALTLWFRAAYLLVSEKPDLSAQDFRRLMGVPRQEVAMLLLARLRARLTGVEGLLFSGEVEAGAVRLRLADGASCVVVAAVEVIRWMDESGDRRELTTRVALERLDGDTGEEIIPFLARVVSPGATVFTPDEPAWARTGELGVEHRPLLDGGVPRLEKMFHTLQATLANEAPGALTIYRVQAALDEFAYRYNRNGSRWVAFNRALGLAVAPQEWQDIDPLRSIVQGPPAWPPRRQAHAT